MVNAPVTYKAKLKTISSRLHDRRAKQVLAQIAARADRIEEYQAEVRAWCETGSELALRIVVRPFGDYWDPGQSSFRAICDQIGAQMRQEAEKTRIGEPK